VFFQSTPEKSKSKMFDWVVAYITIKEIATNPYTNHQIPMENHILALVHVCPGYQICDSHTELAKYIDP